MGCIDSVEGLISFEPIIVLMFPKYGYDTKEPGLAAPLGIFGWVVVQVSALEILPFLNEPS